MRMSKFTPEQQMVHILRQGDSKSAVMIDVP
jgi:hypothetical protein